MNLVIQFRTTILTFLIAFMLSCFGLSPKVLAVLPAPDGGYPGANTAEGDFALFSLTTGASNTAIGFGALGSNTTGSQNTATGVFALVSNTTGFQNAATGVQALFSNTTGFHNAAAGFQALLANTTGNHNTADGDNALVHDTTGSLNTAIGGHALDHNITGSSNVALGFQAGFNITGSGNVCIGENIFGNAGESNVTRIRNIGSTAQANSVFVTVGANGKLGFQASSRRYKDDIKPMDNASEALFSLKPVSFRYKQEIDPARSPDFGLIAEDVAIVNPDLVARDEEGKIVTVRYQAINAMLLNEFLKEHRTVQELKKEVAALMATVKEQASQIQKVNERLEMSRPVPQTVLNNQ
jgi:trimeric autotransporter adhesin